MAGRNDLHEDYPAWPYEDDDDAVECSDCDGSGKTDQGSCTTCGGKGFTTERTYRDLHANDGAYEERGRRPCGRCGAVGIVHRKGSGDWEVCKGCGGDGCAKCAQKGTVVTAPGPRLTDPCPACGGKGNVPEAVVVPDAPTTRHGEASRGASGHGGPCLRQAAALFAARLMEEAPPLGPEYREFEDALADYQSSSTRLKAAMNHATDAVRGLPDPPPPVRPIAQQMPPVVRDAETAVNQGGSTGGKLLGLMGLFLAGFAASNPHYPQPRDDTKFI